MTKRRKKSTYNKLLHGTTTASSPKASITDSLKEGGLILISAIAAGGLGAVIGKHSLLVGIPVAILGVHKQNKYITAAGIGLCLSNGFQKTQAQSQTASVSGIQDDMHGFDVEQIKERLGNYFKNFSEKLYIPSQDQVIAPSEVVSGINESQQPSYFLNPYSNAPSLEGDLDLSQLNKVQAQIAQMNGMGDLQREF